MATFQATTTPLETLVQDQIQIIATKYIPVKAVLEVFYTTAVVNIITWNNAYSLFPLSTFVRYKVHLLVELREHYSSCVRKYSARGWQIQQSMCTEEEHDNRPLEEYRRVGDRYTWKIPLDILRVQWSKVPDFVIEYASFSVEAVRKYGFFERHMEKDTIYNLKALPFDAHCLRYRYIHGQAPQHNPRVQWWLCFLRKRCDWLTTFEIDKLKPQDRPAFNLRRVLNLEAKHVENPDYWVYRDSEIPRWYKEWKDHVARESERELNKP